MSAAPSTGFVTRLDVLRVVLGWLAFAGLLIAAPLLAGPLPALALIATLTGVVAVVTGCAFGVVKQAEALAHRLGDPYGSLVLTLSIVLIEVILIGAVMLGPGEHATIARDSLMAVAMIILNLVIGLSVLVGALRHDRLAHNRRGTSAYLSMIVVLLPLALALPVVVGRDGAFTSGQAPAIAGLTLLLYAFFLYRQTGARAGDFREPSHTVDASASTSATVTTGPAMGIRQMLSEHRREVLTRLALLVVTVLPIVLLSHHLAALLDDGLARVDAPAALAGVLIAMVVFLPESITSVRAGRAGEMQRVSNLCHGALVSTVGLTIPTVLVIGLVSGQEVVLAASPAHLVMLAVTLLLSVSTFAARRLTVVHGAVHLAAFAAYAVVLLVT